MLGDPIEFTVGAERQASHGITSQQSRRCEVETEEQRVNSRSRNLEDRSLVVGAALVGGSVEIAVVSLNQRSDRPVSVRGITFKSMKRGDLAGCRRLVHHAAFAGRISAPLCGSIKVAVGALRRNVWVSAVGVVEWMRGQFSLGRDHVEDAVSTAVDSLIDTVEVPVHSLERRVVGGALVEEAGITVASCAGSKIPQLCPRPCGCDLENGPHALIASAAAQRGSVEIAIGPQRHTAIWGVPGRVAEATLSPEAVQRGVHAGGGHLVDAAVIVGSVGLYRAVEFPVGPLREQGRCVDTGAVIAGVGIGIERGERLGGCGQRDKQQSHCGRREYDRRKYGSEAFHRVSSQLNSSGCMHRAQSQAARLHRASHSSLSHSNFVYPAGWFVAQCFRSPSRRWTNSLHHPPLHVLTEFLRTLKRV